MKRVFAIITALLDDYCRSSFGAGAEHVKKYWILADSVIVPRPRMFPLIKPESLETMRPALIAAAKPTMNEPSSNHRISFLHAGLEFTAITAEAHRLKETAETSGTKPAPTTVSALMERRWQICSRPVRPWALHCRRTKPSTGDEYVIDAARRHAKDVAAGIRDKLNTAASERFPLRRAVGDDHLGWLRRNHDGRKGSRE